MIASSISKIRTHALAAANQSCALFACSVNGTLRGHVFTVEVGPPSKPQVRIMITGTDVVRI
ncbi:MAG: hypothetical protein DMD39_02155 [Gemmatimonadetes bacterium]|nr:MAG: hypothetical protein DMD39_02155 [Gemmatimonadota bacterium]